MGILFFFCLFIKVMRIMLNFYSSSLHLTHVLLLLRCFRGPSNGSRGRVVLVFEDNISAKIGVRFDKPVPGGVDFAGACESGHGFFCYGNFPPPS